MGSIYSNILIQDYPPGFRIPTKRSPQKTALQLLGVCASDAEHFFVPFELVPRLADRKTSNSGIPKGAAGRNDADVSSQMSKIEPKVRII